MDRLLAAILGIAVIIFIALIVVSAQTDYSGDKKQPVAAPNDTEPGSRPETGLIWGSFTYPSEKIPDNLKACAENISTKHVLCSDRQIKSSEYLFGVGFELEVPIGEYFVYAQNQSNRAYYNQYTQKYVDTGAWPDYNTKKCQSEYQPAKVTIDANTTSNNLLVGDWYFATSCP